MKADLQRVKRGEAFQLHPVVKGHVWCPVRGRVDVELCFYCEFMEWIDLDSRAPKIGCKPDVKMSDDEKVAYERLGVLQLAEALGNVSQACRERGISKRRFYEYKHRFEAFGVEGLKDRPRGGKPRVADAAREQHPPL
ncbi:MAG: helix-turn-helix domain-containing protein [Alicyclobacillus sp.]|nr:helix-turn-helix domain-containing protein [Alicyclobacillus sp.]